MWGLESRSRNSRSQSRLEILVRSRSRRLRSRLHHWYVLCAYAVKLLSDFFRLFWDTVRLFLVKTRWQPCIFVQRWGESQSAHKCITAILGLRCARHAGIRIIRRFKKSCCEWNMHRCVCITLRICADVRCWWPCSIYKICSIKCMRYAYSL